MKNYILFLLLFILIGCKTTHEDYSKFPFIDEESIKSENYEIITLMPEKYDLRNMLGYMLTRNSFSPEKEERTWSMPIIYFDKKRSIYFITYDVEKSMNYYIRYNLLSNKVDSIKNQDSIKNLQHIFEENYKKDIQLVDFKFPEAEKYYKIVKTEQKDTISDKYFKWTHEKYPNNEEKRKEAEKLLTFSYKTSFIVLQIPKEDIKFKYNLSPNGKILFFGNEDLHKKGYIYIYIYKSSNITSHSGGLYVIRPKENKN